ncbi:MAG: integrase core domain-containing protein, partial [Candidatus Omnitrophota bacterium]
IERFHGRIKKDVLRRYIFENKEDMEKKLVRYVNHYNFEVRLRKLNYQTPAGFLKDKFQRSLQPIVS